MQTITARIFNIQRFSIQDGPGIRTTVFFKGCPLKCTWCSNPESQTSVPELLYRRQNCQACFRCAERCPKAAIKPEQNGITIDRALCDRCFDCVEACCSDALDRTGCDMGLEEVLIEVRKDKLFYKNSKGGVTLSGGEPLAQIEFAEQLLKILKQDGIDTTVDTCGHVPWDKFETILPYTDRLLYDLKHLNPALHRRETGVDNKLILENLSRVLTAGAVPVWLRIPIIPGLNDSEDHACQIAKLLTGKSIEKISLLPYHPWGVAKYRALGRDYHWPEEQVHNDTQLNAFLQILQRGGFNVTIGY